MFQSQLTLSSSCKEKKIKALFIIIITEDNSQWYSKVVYLDYQSNVVYVVAFCRVARCYQRCVDIDNYKLHVRLELYCHESFGLPKKLVRPVQFLTEYGPVVGELVLPKP